METFIYPKEMVKDNAFMEKRSKEAAWLDLSTIDPQIKDIIKALQALPHCFSLQSCDGHIIEPRTDGGYLKIDPDPESPATWLYQIAYLALVLENSPDGQTLYQHLAEIPRLDVDFIQFGSAEWFWNTQGFCNSYVIQVCPYKFRHLDRFTMSAEEAKKWINARDLFFHELKRLV